MTAFVVVQMSIFLQLQTLLPSRSSIVRRVLCELTTKKVGV